MKFEKKYYSIREVSEILNIKEHVIRHWDSVDPKTNKLRIENLSLRTNGGTRFFNKYHIKKLSKLNNLLRENGKKNHTLNLASKLLLGSKDLNKYNPKNKDKDNKDSFLSRSKIDKIRYITNNLKNLLITK